MTLREAGAAPQRITQYATLAGTRHVRVSAGDARPTATMTFLVDVDTAAGTAPIHARFRGVDALTPQSKDGPSAPDPQIGEFVRHVAGTLASDVHGRATANVDSDKVWTTPSLPAVLSMAIVPLPTEPIGVGARWRVTGADPVLAVTDAVFDYQATALDANGATVSWTAKATTKGVVIAMDGTTTIRFADLIPVRATITQHVPASGQIPALDFVITIE